MSKAIRVVVADDSAFIRRIICSHLESTDGFEVVGTAENGREAVDLVQQLRPDVLTLDVDMPTMSGIEALEEVMRETPTPIVMVSGVSLRAAETTLRAIQSGAVDFILKYVPGVKVNPEELRLDLISKVRAASEIRVVRTIQGRKSKQKKVETPTEQKVKTVRGKKHSEMQRRLDAGASTPDLVVIGASTGGPIAIRELLARLPHDFSPPIIIVQHIPQPFTEVLAAQLNSQLPFHTKVVQGGEKLEPRKVYIAPGDRHLMLNNLLQLELHDGPPISGHRPSIDVTMKSIAQYFPQTVFGVLLTGMGTDGASGLEFIRSKGGHTFAQSSETCVVNGMPNAAIELGAVDHVASPEGIADRLALEITRRQSQRLAEQAAEQTRARAEKNLETVSQS